MRRSQTGKVHRAAKSNVTDLPGSTNCYTGVSGSYLVQKRGQSQPVGRRLPHTNPHDNADSDEQTRQILRRKPTQCLPRSKQCHSDQGGPPRAKQPDDPRVDQCQKGHAGGKRAPDKGERGRRREAFFVQGGLDDAPTVYRADDPKGDHAAAEDDGPTVAAVRDAGVGEL